MAVRLKGAVAENGSVISFSSVRTRSIKQSDDRMDGKASQSPIKAVVAVDPENVQRPLKAQLQQDSAVSRLTSPVGKKSLVLHSTRSNMSKSRKKLTRRPKQSAANKGQENTEPIIDLVDGSPAKRTRRRLRPDAPQEGSDGIIDLVEVAGTAELANESEFVANPSKKLDAKEITDTTNDAAGGCHNGTEEVVSPEIRKPDFQNSLYSDNVHQQLDHQKAERTTHICEHDASSELGCSPERTNERLPSDSDDVSPPPSPVFNSTCRRTQSDSTDRMINFSISTACTSLTEDDVSTMKLLSGHVGKLEPHLDAEIVSHLVVETSQDGGGCFSVAETSIEYAYAVTLTSVTVISHQWVKDSVQRASVVNWKDYVVDRPEIDSLLLCGFRFFIPSAFLDDNRIKIEIRTNLEMLLEKLGASLLDGMPFNVDSNFVVIPHRWSEVAVRSRENSDKMRRLALDYRRTAGTMVTDRSVIKCVLSNDRFLLEKESIRY